MTRLLLIGALLTVGAGVASAHEVRPAYLELRQVGATRYDVLWKVPGRGDDLRLAIYVELPKTCTRASVPTATLVDSVFTERWRVECSSGLTGGTIRIVGLSATVTDALVRLERADGTTVVERLTPDRASFVVEAVPGALDVARAYLALGVHHILFGIDHLLYILAMLFLVRGWRRIVATMTAFTMTHSLTLTAAALGWVHVPQPPVEACIALSIVFVAREIVQAGRGQPGLTARWPWVVSFSFGLMHGFGFASALAEVGLPARAIPVALLFFNVGVEIGQLVFVAAVLGLFFLLARIPKTWPRWAEAVPAYSIGAVAMFWVIERIAAFAGP